MGSTCQYVCPEGQLTTKSREVTCEGELDASGTVISYGWDKDLSMFGCAAAIRYIHQLLL